MKKIRLFLFALIMMLPISMVSASQLYSDLTYVQIGYGSSLTGGSRNLPAGYNFFYLKNYYFYDQSGNVTYSGYSKIRTSYIEDHATYSTLIGYADKDVSHLDSFLLDWGYLAAGTRYYSFSTKINGTSYLGQYASPVKIQVNSNYRFY
ncbi:MAG: hypothetical protein IJ565_02490 [Bacilli bacterium]|nr:hypothetical protein [Bacilli bacterium]